MREKLTRRPWFRNSAAVIALGLTSFGTYEVFASQGEGPKSATAYEKTFELDKLIADLPSDGTALEDANESTTADELKCDETVREGFLQDGTLNLHGNPACRDATLGQEETITAAHQDLQNALVEGSEPVWQNALGGASIAMGIGIGAALLSTRRR